ncbi:MAG: hypothetical protein J7M14_01430 [Planctomycetes bacterium]|nr:hypothetical protein [Planctomycetota bacterium]
MAVALLIGVIAALPGCSDNSSRHAGRNILAEIDKAQRLYGRAAAMLADVAFEVDGRPAPVFKKVGDPDKITWSEGPVNPQAWAALEQADSALRQVKKDNSQAPGDVKALADQVLARVLVLKAYCRSLEARDARGAVTDGIDAARDTIAVMRGNISLLSYLDRLATISDEDITTIISKAVDTVARLKILIQRKEYDKSRRTRNRNALRERSARLSAKAGDLRQQSDLARGVKSLELFDESQVYERQATQLGFNIQEAEYAIESLKLDINELKLQIAAATQRQALAEAILADRKKDAKYRDTVRSSASATLEEMRIRAESYVGAIADACGKLTAAEDDVLKYYAKAAKLMKSAKFRAGAERRGRKAKAGSGENFAAQASVLASAGALQAQSLLVEQSKSLLVAEVTELWPKLGHEVPAAVADIQGYLPDPGEVRQAALEAYEQAGDLYEKASRVAEKNHKWLYQAHLASVHYALDKLGKEGALDEAREVIAVAVEGKRASPYLEDAVQMERMITERAGGK